MLCSHYVLSKLHAFLFMVIVFEVSTLNSSKKISKGIIVVVVAGLLSFQVHIGLKLMVPMQAVEIFEQDSSRNAPG